MDTGGIAVLFLKMKDLSVVWDNRVIFKNERSLGRHPEGAPSLSRGDRRIALGRHPEGVPSCRGATEGSHLMNDRQYYVYIATNRGNTVLYTGVTNNLARRAFEHKNKLAQGFTSRYNIHKIVYYEVFATPGEAIAAEKRIKGWTRRKKLNLIQGVNPHFRNLIE